MVEFEALIGSILPGGVLTIFIIVSVVAVFIGLFSDFLNVICVFGLCLAIIIAAYVYKGDVLRFMVNAQAFDEKQGAVISFSSLAVGVFFGIIGLVRGSPLIWAWKENRTFLILGTLVKETNFLAGIGASLAYGGVFIIIAYNCFNAAVAQASVLLFVLPAIIMCVLCVLSGIFKFVLKG